MKAFITAALACVVVASRREDEEKEKQEAEDLANFLEKRVEGRGEEIKIAGLAAKC